MAGTPWWRRAGSRAAVRTNSYPVIPCDTISFDGYMFCCICVIYVPFMSHLCPIYVPLNGLFGVVFPLDKLISIFAQPQ